MQLTGQKANLDIINKWEQLPNFLIIQGNANTGKHYMVLYLCNKFHLGYVKVANTAKAVRNLVDIMLPNANLVYHLDNFTDASLQAKNALLKITEEPIPGNHIVITGGPQIKTLESRARRLIMAPYSFEEVQQHLSLYYDNVQDQLQFYKAGIDTPAKVEFYKSYEDLKSVYNLAQQTFGKLTVISPEYIITLLQNFDDKCIEQVDKCLLFLKMLISLIENNIKDVSYYSYYKVLNILIRAKQNLEYEPTLRRKLLLYHTFYEIYSLRSDV